MLAGEAIFLLPFVLPRIFRPTVLEVFQINNYQLGTAFSLYGLIALASYFFGGIIADKYSARKLMSLALGTTGLLGFYLAAVPNVYTLHLLYMGWGFSTIFLFWAPMLRTTRLIGGQGHQGLAFGMLDAGRGLTAALLASFSVLIVARIIPGNNITYVDRRDAMEFLITGYNVFILVTALLVWFLIPDTPDKNTTSSRSRPVWSGVRKILDRKMIWLNAIIVMCAYVGYKCADDLSLYAFDVYHLDDVESAKVGTLTFWIRPIIAVFTGYLADRFSSSRVIVVGFSLMVAGSFMLGYNGPAPQTAFFMMIICLSVGIYGVRGVYFALFDESAIQIKYTGAAIGIISVIGFTPDIFFGPLMGIILDNNPGPTGHYILFRVVAGFGLVGLISAVLFSIESKRLVNPG